ncbi:hypothetical protein ACUN24_11240 [Pedobacter sp. WC2501]|uniref:hypothetical protein n=1 Tax=Pedobacter sp. WC2501 TaxID=3461400 RepID=UPI004045C406
MDDQFINGWKFKNGQPESIMKVKAVFFDRNAKDHIGTAIDAISLSNQNKVMATNGLVRPKAFATRPLPTNNDGGSGDGTGGSDGSNLCVRTIIDHYYRGCSTFNGLTTCTEWKYNGSTLIAEKCNQDPGATASPPPPVNYQQFESNNDGYIAVTLPVRGNTNPNAPNGNRDIHNKTTDPCISKIVDSLLGSKNISNKMDSILKRFNKDASVQINIYDTSAIAGNKPGETYGGHWENGIFSINIKLNNAILLNASREFIASTIMHEVLHAYFRDVEGKPEIVDEMDHNTMAEKYILPMSNYLVSVFGISQFDATAIVWEGLKESNIYKNSSNFEVGEGNGKTIVTKSDLSFRGTEYYLRLGNTGKSPCN